MSEIDDVLEMRAHAVGELAYLKARKAQAFANRLHRNKSLYFALCGDAVKVGISSSPDARLETLQTGAPGKIRLLTVIGGAGHREAECHKRLAHLHLHGEWFRYTSDVDVLIRDLSNE